MMNSDGDIETIVKKLLEGPGDVSIVPLGAAVEVAEALAEAENVSLLSDLMERMLPRLTKKERFDEIETLWIAACTIGAIRRPVMMRTIEKLVGREMVDEAGELLMMLVDAVIEAEGDEEALEITTESLAWSKSEGFIACAARSLENLFGEVKGFSVILARFEREAPEEGVEAMERASRALRFAPGTFLRLSDWTIARVHSTDGVTAKISHPSGSLEERRVDEKPPPKVLSPAGHEVRALFDTEALSKQWIDNPMSILPILLEEQEGSFNVPSLKAMLVPRLVTEGQYDAILARLKLECSMGREDSPRYESKRRLFIGAGVPTPAAKTPKSNSASTPREKQPQLTKIGRPSSSNTPVRANGPKPKWIDLTSNPEVRALLVSVEVEIDVLNHELNVDLPVRLEEALAHGDLKENAEYDAAKERLRFVQSRVDQLRNWLGKLHELSKVRLIPGRITIMSRVVVEDDETGATRSFRLVPAELPDPQPGDVSVGTPYGRALNDHVVGDVVVVKLPKRVERLEIRSIVDPTSGG